MFYVPSSVTSDETYEYALTASARNAESATAFVTVRVLNGEALALACADPGSVYEGSEDIAFDCAASGAPEGSDYEYAWRARGGTANTDLLSATDGPAPTFLVPDEVDSDETYEYLLTVSAANAEDASVEVTVTVLNREALALACADPGSVYEGSADITLDCSASGAPEGSDYEYAWTARGDTQDMSLLSAVDMASPTFYVPDEVDEDETYEYLLTVSADNAEDASVEVTVTVLNKGALAVVCTDPGSVYEGSEDIAFDCEASGAPGDRPQYAYAWTAREDTQDMSLLSAVDMASPTFFVPDEVSRRRDLRVPFDGFCGQCGRRVGRGNGDGAEQGRACRCMRGPGFGLRGLGRYRVRLLGIRGSGRQPRVRVRVDGSGGYAGHVAAQRCGHCFADVLGAGRSGCERDV